MKVQMIFENDRVNEKHKVLGSIHLDCSRIYTYTADASGPGYVEIIIKDPKISLVNWIEPILEGDKDG